MAAALGVGCQTRGTCHALPRSPPLLVLCAERRLRLDVCLLMAGLTAAEPLAPHSELPITAGCQQTLGGR